MSSQSSDGLVGRDLAERVEHDIHPDTRTYVFVRALIGYLLKSVVKNSQSIDADALLQTVMCYTTEVYKSPEFEMGRQYLAEYRGSFAKESDGYEPLAKCLNEALGALAKKPMPELRDCTPGLGDLYVHVNGETDITHKYPLNTIIHPEPEDLRVRGPLMKGRATCLLKVSHLFQKLKGQQNYVEITDEDKKKSFVIKASWPESQRRNEIMLIFIAKRRLAEKFNNYLPENVTMRELGYTGELDEGLMEFGAKRKVQTFPRSFRLIIFGQLDPLSDITDEDKFMKVWLDCLICHYELWEKDIQHGDISVWNLMFRPDPTLHDSVQGYGVVNDFDLSLIDPTTETEYCGGQRTGTLPFMARETLTSAFTEGKILRTYIHELECFLWVFTWLCLRDYPNLGNLEWRVGTFDTIERAKRAFVDEFNPAINPQSSRIDDSKIKYPLAWKKCKLLWNVLNLHDLHKGSIFLNKRPYNILYEHLYREVIRIVEGDGYGEGELEELKDKFGKLFLLDRISDTGSPVWYLETRLYIPNGKDANIR